jgi:ABC-type multidrug transport system fused ATPase/permease subunit
MGVANGLATAMLVFAAGMRIQTGAISPGEWYLFMQAVGFFWYPLMGIASFWSQFQDGLSAAERVFALIDAQPDVEQIANEPVEELEGRIEFKKLRFSYSEKEIVLPDFSLMIHPGKTLALVGHSGAGKSSIVKLISRFYEYQEGELLINGRDIRRLDLDVYRRNLGLVPQDPFLFSGTVAENIRYSRPEATEKDVRQAAEHISGDRPPPVDCTECRPNYHPRSRPGHRGWNAQLFDGRRWALCRSVQYLLPPPIAGIHREHGELAAKAVLLESLSI